MNNQLRCPKCFRILEELCLTSSPPQYQVFCHYKCGFRLPYYKRENKYLHITQEELNKYNDI